jgi:serine/threonine protein kinase
MMQDVAVKVFKGNVTSDGYPEDEMNSSLEAGEHDTLVKILGVTDNIVESKTGLVMELIPKHYVNLGNPPSLKTCTRDVFDPKVSYSANQILNILTSISSVANHLHERGIMHGDLYAHNMLIDDEGNTLFGDFGAATMYERDLLTDTYALERIEVSAFGYLVDDLLSLYHVSKNDHFSTALTSLKTLCLSPISNSRPNFEEIESILAKIKSGI